LAAGARYAGATISAKNTAKVSHMTTNIQAARWVLECDQAIDMAGKLTADCFTGLTYLRDKSPTSTDSKISPVLHHN
jgi:hypothetical protein